MVAPTRVRVVGFLFRYKCNLSAYESMRVFKNLMKYGLNPLRKTIDQTSANVAVTFVKLIVFFLRNIWHFESIQILKTPKLPLYQFSNIRPRKSKISVSFGLKNVTTNFYCKYLMPLFFVKFLMKLFRLLGISHYKIFYYF